MSINPAGSVLISAMVAGSQRHSVAALHGAKQVEGHKLVGCGAGIFHHLQQCVVRDRFFRNCLYLWRGSAYVSIRCGPRMNEGAETRLEWNLLSRPGCDPAQDHYVTAPMETGEFFMCVKSRRP
ncbi:MAG: hypothetical protein ABI905_10520 [Betaproteobacteria bacterium]